MKKAPFIGSGVALITPFNENTVNYKVLEELIEYQIANNTDAIIICGTTGEPSTMTESEKKEVIRFTVEKVNKRIPVIAGTGSNCTRTAIEMSKYAQSIGVDGVLVVTPYYNKTTQKGLVEHYKSIAENINIPIIMYNVPGRTGLNLLPTTIKELSKIENIVAVKEASGNFSQIAEIANLCGEDIYIYSGNDDQIVPVLSLGGVGVISVLANVAPNETHEIVSKFLKGDIEKSRELQLKLLPLINALFCEVNPIPVKEAVRLIGFNVGNVRLPLVPMSNDNREKLKETLKIITTQ
ncbi:MAG: 4-hydroxy-tetrahydrodipicolinate synthase [Clostridiales bacterium]|nr:4-hydroxy-tetrahydrodipicolinate synthase [Clostridiales bacterium]